MMQLFDSDLKCALEAVGVIEAIAEGMKEAGMFNIALALIGETMTIKSVLNGAITANPLPEIISKLEADQ